MNESTNVSPQRRRWRSMLWSLLAIAVLSMALPTIGYVMAQSGQPQVSFGDRSENPRSATWREAREGQPGFTVQTGPYVTNTMMNNSGETWRQFRTGPLVGWGGWLMGGALVLIALFYFVAGRVKLEHGRAGMTIERWKGYERALHWFVAISFVLLTITGLSMLFGRYVLIPVMGAEGFSWWATIAMNIHNYLGPAFSIGLLLMILLWARHNIPNATDVAWFKQGGGLVGKGHPSAGKLNGGEKVWFWGGVFVLGILVSVSGVILDFPIWGQTRSDMALAQGVHAIAAILWICFFFGHAYIGTLGTEGALEGMTTGRVDVNWAKQHHDLWLEEELAKGVKPQPAEDKASGSAGAVGQPSH
jgi:formate dehydrogenase subunit gamma